MSTFLEHLFTAFSAYPHSPDFLKLARHGDQAGAFSRRRKLPLPALVAVLISGMRKSVQTELDEFFGHLEQQVATVGAMAWLLSHPVTARAAAPAPFRVQCPQSLPAGMLHGAPDEQAYLKPTSGGKTMRGKRAVFVTRWTFDVPHGYETWMYCGYGAVELARRIPVTATECTVTTEYEGKQRMPPIFVCR